jgi:hypothetical protein
LAIPSSSSNQVNLHSQTHVPSFSFPEFVVILFLLGIGTICGDFCNRKYAERSNKFYLDKVNLLPYPAEQSLTKAVPL